MKRLNKIEAVTERDIDLLLLEELNVSDDFSEWFYSTITKSNDKPLCTGAWHSISSPILGESDLIALYNNGVAILIEIRLKPSYNQSRVKDIKREVLKVFQMAIGVVSSHA